jgi:site-specific DNA recombinase
MIPAISYRRVSTKEQGEYGYSLETQRSDIAAYAERHGYVLVADYADDETGTTLDRPGLTQARKDLQQGKARAIIAHDSDRLTRKASHYVELREEFFEQGTELHYALRGLVRDDFGGQITEDFYGRFAQEWRRKLLENTRQGKRTKVKSGKVIVSQRPPYGYRADDGRLIVHEEEAEVIRLIFKLYTVDNYSMAKIASHLTSLNIPTYKDIHPDRGGPSKKRPFGFWHHRVIHYILTNETYCGTWAWGKSLHRAEWLTVEVPAIVSRATWERAQEFLKLNKERSARNTRHSYLLAKRIKCGFCGRSVYAAVRNNRLYYYCSTRQGDKFGPDKCGLVYHRAQSVEDRVWYWIKRVLREPDYFQQIVAASIDNHSDEIDTLTNEQNLLRANLAQKEAQRRKLIMTFLEEQEAEDIKPVRDGLTAEIAEIKSQLDETAARLRILILSQDKTLEFARVFFDGQAMLNNADNDEPFEVRQSWVKALNLNLTLGHSRNNNLIKVSCFLDTDLVNCGTHSLDYIPQLTYVINLTELSIS